MKKLKFTEQVSAPTLKLDLGTGKGATRPEGFIGVDKVKHPGVTQVVDLRKRWPWKANSVDEVQASHLLQYFTSQDRWHFVHELYRVLKAGGKATIITPYWAACKAYGDLTACYPPVSEAWFFRLNKAWREQQNYDDPDGYTCNFDHSLGYGMHQSVAVRNPEYQQHAISFWKEAAQDLCATLVKL